MINLAFDALERANLSPADRTPEQTTATPDDSISFDANAPLPDLKHTKVLHAMVGGRPVKPNWNNVVRHMLRLAVDEGHSVDEIRRLCAVNLVAGEKDDEGYHYLAEMHMSYQGGHQAPAPRPIRPDRPHDSATDFSTSSSIATGGPISPSTTSPRTSTLSLWRLPSPSAACQAVRVWG